MGTFTVWHWLVVLVIGGIIYAKYRSAQSKSVARDTFQTATTLRNDSQRDQTTILNERSAGVNTKVVFARHIVGIVILLLIQPLSTYKVSGFLETWLVTIVLVFGVAGIVTGLAWLFFTRQETGKSARTFLNTSWIVAALILLGRWLQ